MDIGNYKLFKKIQKKFTPNIFLTLTYIFHPNKNNIDTIKNWNDRIYNSSGKGVVNLIYSLFCCNLYLAVITNTIFFILIKKGVFETLYYNF